jgi:oxalate decarboxylase
MSDPQRRAFLAAAGIASLAALGGTQPAAGGDPSFMNNVPDPTLAGKDLPTFKFALEKSDGKVIGSSYGKEATVAQLPISKGIAGVSMRLEPGAMRELHWHATAAEWAFVLEAASAPPSSTQAALPRPTISNPATSGTSRAATATCCNVSATSLVTSS